MSNSIIYTISFDSYCEILSKIEDKFNSYKFFMLKHNLILQHPSLFSMNSNRKYIEFIEKHYSRESTIFGTSLNFLNCLVLINYHLGSFLQISEIKEIKTNDIQTISISVENLLILDSFKSL